MTKEEHHQEVRDRERVLRAQRGELEADLTQLTELMEAESAKWAERRSSVQALGQKLPPDTGEGDEDARMAWYVAAYEDAQHTLVMTQGLMLRYNEVAQALTSCQQELMQLARDHRRG